VKRFTTTCIDSTANAINTMTDSARKITRRTFLSHVDRDELAGVESGLGYELHPANGLTMAGDYHVGYFKSRYRGKPCVYFDWSRIEHVFI